MTSKKQMIIDVLLEELRKIRKEMKIAYGISSEKTVQHYLVINIKNIDEVIEATKHELKKSCRQYAHTKKKHYISHRYYNTKGVTNK